MHILKGSQRDTWEQVEAVQHEPFVYIASNGSHWFDEEPDDIQLLLNALHRWTLDPVWESYGNFIKANPCRGVVNPDFTFDIVLTPKWIDGPRLFEADVTMFSGNFYGVSHGFSIYTNDVETIEKLTLAIRANQATPEYTTAKTSCNSVMLWGAKTLKHAQGNHHRSDLAEINHATTTSSKL